MGGNALLSLASVIKLDKLAFMAEQGLMTLDEAAAYLGVAKVTLRRWTRDGHLACVRIGKRQDRRFRRSDLDAYIRRNRRPKSRTSGNGGAKKVKRPSKSGQA